MKTLAVSLASFSALFFLFPLPFAFGTTISLFEFSGEDKQAAPAGMVAGTLIICEGAVTDACKTPSLQSATNVSDVVIFNPAAATGFPNGQITLFSDFPGVGDPMLSNRESLDTADTNGFMNDAFKQKLIAPFVFSDESAEGTTQGIQYTPKKGPPGAPPILPDPGFATDASGNTIMYNIRSDTAIEKVGEPFSFVLLVTGLGGVSGMALFRHKRGKGWQSG
jgi:hypothetical protein